jgi:hypothetical protein
MLSQNLKSKLQEWHLSTSVSAENWAPVSLPEEVSANLMASRGRRSGANSKVGIGHRIVPT